MASVCRTKTNADYDADQELGADNAISDLQTTVRDYVREFNASPEQIGALVTRFSEATLIEHGLKNYQITVRA